MASYEEIVSTLTVDQYSQAFLAFLDTCNGRETRSRVRHMFVDEVQDIDDVQFGIIKKFHESGACITCVGDDAQNIYTFRNSNIGYIRNFRQWFPNANVCTMLSNYRCNRAIVDIANASVQKGDGIQKAMSAMDGKTALPVRVVYHERVEQETSSIVSEVRNLIANGTPLDQIAILCPINKHLYKLEEALARHNVAQVLLDGKGDARSRPKPNHVCLSTIHKAKGLEWRHVILIGVHDEVLPFRRATQEDINEGRRLFYVAITRARSTLSMYFTRTGGVARMTRFIAELPRELFKFENCQQCHFMVQPCSIQKRPREVSAPLPYIESTKDTLQLYDPVEVHDFVSVNDVYPLFNAFLRLLFQCMVVTEPSRRRYPPAVDIISGIILDYEENTMYRLYKDNFDHSLANIQNVIRSSNVYKKRSDVLRNFLTFPVKTVPSNHVSIIVRILRKMEKAHKRHNTDMADVRVMRKDQTLASCHTEDVARALARFKSVHEWQSLIPDIWTLCKCEFVLDNARKRYFETMRVTYEDLMTYKDGLYQNMATVATRALVDMDFERMTFCPCHHNAMTAIAHSHDGTSTLLHVGSATQSQDDLLKMMHVKQGWDEEGGEFGSPVVRAFVTFSPLQGEWCVHTVI
jgi:hypothetical protein